jgi:ubiquinone/menaquinone biosynthesis C-methylase UbiE
VSDAGGEGKVTDKTADYSEIAEVYDAARRPDKPHIEWWLVRLAQAGGLASGKRLLDLGCGTGRWTIALVERTGCRAVGVDRSPEMLAEARAKDRTGGIEWIVGDVNGPPVEPASFDCALMSLMLHHLPEPLVAFRAALAALRPGGVLLVRQGTLEQIMGDVTHRFFPETLTIDRKRTPLGAEVEMWLRQAGFVEVAAERTRLRQHDSPQEWLLEVEPRVCSVLRMISDEAHARGLARLREHIENHPDDPSLVMLEMTLFIGRRPT